MMPRIASSKQHFNHIIYIQSNNLYDLFHNDNQLQVYQDLPLTLVLGLTTTAAALHSLLDSEVIDRCMELHHFKLVGPQGGCGGCERRLGPRRVLLLLLRCWLLKDVPAAPSRVCWNGSCRRAARLHVGHAALPGISHAAEGAAAVALEKRRRQLASSACQG